MSALQPHRILRPGARGSDVRSMQDAANHRLHARGQGHYKMKVDGVLGEESIRGCSRALYVIGVHGRRFRQSKAPRGVFDLRAQEVIRFPARRTRRMRALERVRLAKLRVARRLSARRLPKRMYDAVTIENMPLDAKAVAGYVGGRFQTFPRLAERFPHARRVSIAVASNQDADVLDIEPGDSRPELAPMWAKRQLERGKVPKLYSSVSEMPEVLRQLAINGISRSQVRLWTAHYTHVPHLCDSRCGFGFNDKADATQFTNRALGRSLDESVTSRRFWK